MSQGHRLILIPQNEVRSRVSWETLWVSHILPILLLLCWRRCLPPAPSCYCCSCNLPQVWSTVVGHTTGNICMCTDLCLQEMLSDIFKGIPIWMISPSMSTGLLNMTETSLLMEAGLVLNEHKCLFRMSSCFEEGQRNAGDSILPDQEHTDAVLRFLPIWCCPAELFSEPGFFASIVGPHACMCQYCSQVTVGWVLSFHKYSSMLLRTQWLLLLTHCLKHSESSHWLWRNTLLASGTDGYSARKRSIGLARALPAGTSVACRPAIWIFF